MISESEEITIRLEQHALWLKDLRVSQDGWAKVLRQNTEDTEDLAQALRDGKIVAHIPTHLKPRKHHDKKENTG